MEVLVLSNLYPDEVRPACGVFVQYQVSKLSQRGHEITVLSPHPYVPPIPGLPEQYRRLHSQVQYERKESGVHVKYPRTLSLPNPWTQPVTALVSRFRSKNWVQQLESSNCDPDIINVHVAQPNGYAALAMREYFDVPLVTTIHGADVNLLYDQVVNRYFIKKSA
ncbi:glycosyltransferase [Halostagnicola sp. A56]|uniref:glycosyltransferase n=1 Tax=Halostagnicola sp. A56 TaxID=1495067 RepID=UPI0018CE9A0D